MQLKTPIRSELAVVCVAAFFLAALNVAFWRQFVGALAPLDAHEWLFVIVTAVTFFALLSLFFSVFAFPYLFKPAIALFLLLTSAAVYFINEYGVVIDSEMIRNIMHTNTGEAYDLLTGKLVIYVVGLGLLPALVLWLLPIAYRPFWQELGSRPRVTALVLPLISLIILPLTGTAMSFFRENRILVRVIFR